MNTPEARQQAVRELYNTYPFPPEPLLDEPPPGYNWRWHWQAAYNFCTNRKPIRNDVRILDAGCGTGVGTEYLLHLNPEAEIVGIDLSEGALEVAQKRCSQSGVRESHQAPVTFQRLPIEQAAELEGEFDLINCVGVLHHMPDPVQGIKALAKKVAPGGLFHIFVYAELGRWEIQLMQEAIALFQGEKRGDYVDGVKVGRDIFGSLPENSRLVQYDKERWSLENHRDASFADMYVHPQETDYNIHTLFELIDASGLEFVGFSNPPVWDLERLVGKSPDLMARAQHLGERERYRLIELLDTTISHYEFFLARPPLEITDWSDDALLRAAIAEVHPCLNGWPSKSFFDFDYRLISINDEEYEFMSACDRQHTIGSLLEGSDFTLDDVRSLQKRQLIMLSPA
ncbi:class I SAM-dependent methyltransferase [[Limnothrix rosea] IAM M-220]|uniref:class I SAM-dependent methyltransferase n=1 Tax=[Limnothrix rosea] IAM M-220 TaxID=454133 RepID=UPI00095A6A33|nr:class I SAM-dependent methyltransferase [[Limnothrix rosea] IAM M-220]OKH16839.1 SAM-dependent methyltransferase [[Limnothrix rosea] IAM M-220]